uniref:DUF4939 domain-containing protein n=1 Tax=Sinocyclocheilus anshuiensis TaxID=1608454 RepID=A0A671RKW5_9TELE
LECRGKVNLFHTSSPEPLPIRTVTASPHACPMARPASFSGEAAFCSGFLLQCSLYLEMQPHLFVTEWAKVSFIISLLSGRALQWAEALWNSQISPIHRSLPGLHHHPCRGANGPEEGGCRSEMAPTDY